MGALLAADTLQGPKVDWFALGQDPKEAAA